MFLKYLLLFSILFIQGCKVEKNIDPNEGLYERNKFKRATLVLRVKLITKGSGSKYYWPKVKIIKIFKNSITNPVSVNQILMVAHYNSEPGIPVGISTLYLEKYSPEGKEWALLKRSGREGVSHTEK